MSPEQKHELAKRLHETIRRVEKTLAGSFPDIETARELADRAERQADELVDRLDPRKP